MYIKSTVFLSVFLFIISLRKSVIFAQQSGAYSSPQYDKKGYQKYYNSHTFSDTNYQKIPPSDYPKHQQNDRSKHHEIDISEYSNHQVESIPNSKTFNHSNDNGNGNLNANYVNPINNNLSYNDTQNGRSSGGFMETAGQFLHGKGGQMLAEIARDLISRSTGASSQVGPGEGCWSKVLSLNLTNLVILVILKALILAAGMFGAGAWTHGYGRSIDESSNSQWISGSELDLWMSYLQGRPECLQQAACKSPKLAKKYSGGADLILTLAKFTNGVLPYDVRYEKALAHVKEATTWGAAGMKCEERYKCFYS